MPERAMPVPRQTIEVTLPQDTRPKLAEALTIRRGSLPLLKVYGTNGTLFQNEDGQPVLRIDFNHPVIKGSARLLLQRDTGNRFIAVAVLGSDHSEESEDSVGSGVRILFRYPPNKEKVMAWKLVLDGVLTDEEAKLLELNISEELTKLELASKDQSRHLRRTPAARARIRTRRHHMIGGGTEDPMNMVLGASAADVAMSVAGGTLGTYIYDKLREIVQKRKEEWLRERMAEAHAAAKQVPDKEPRNG